MKGRRFRFVAAAFAVAAEIPWFAQSALKITTPGGKVLVIQPGEMRKFP